MFTALKLCGNPSRAWFSSKSILRHASVPFAQKIRLCKTGASAAVVKDEFSGLSLADTQVQRFLDSLTEEYTQLSRTEIRNRDGHRRLSILQPLIDCNQRRATVLDNLDQLAEEMRKEQDKDLLAMMDDEKRSFEQAIKELDIEVMRTIFSMNDDESCSSLIFEVTTGVGGQEAMLFARELYDMYSGYIEYKGWSTDILQLDNTELGGIRHASAIVTGANAYDFLRFEGGVHRVQRIPTTERAGRVHTSTVSVAVIPRPDDLGTFGHTLLIRSTCSFFFHF